MVHYKLSYFDLRARGELIRLIFKYAKQDFDDNRIQFSEWPKLKSSNIFCLLFKKKILAIPYGQVPLLEIDEKKLSQSLAIARYLAKEFGKKFK